MLKITWNTHNYFHTFSVISNHGCFMLAGFWKIKLQEFLGNEIEIQKNNFE